MGMGAPMVNEFMTPEPFVVSAREPVASVRNVLGRHGIDQIPVTDDKNRLVGIVTERDLRRDVGQGKPRTANLRAMDVMTREVITISPATTMEEALAILIDRRFSALPVVVCGFVVGMLSTRDLLRRFLEMLKEGTSGPADRSAGLVLHRTTVRRFEVQHDH